MRDFLRFLETASASLTELEYLISFIVENDILNNREVRELQPLQHEASRVLLGLAKALRKKLQVSNDWQRTIIADGISEYIAGEYRTDDD